MKIKYKEHRECIVLGVKLVNMTSKCDVHYVVS